MMKTLPSVVSWLIAGSLLSAVAHAAPSVYPTGVTRYDPAKAYNQYVIFSGADKQTHLIDMNGNAMENVATRGLSLCDHRPDVGGRRARPCVVATQRPRPRPAGLGRQRAGQPQRGRAGLARQRDLAVEGDKAPGGAAQQHHDQRRLSNGNTLVLANKVHAVAGFKVPQVIDDAIYEVSPDGAVTWRWLASRHLNEFGFTPEQLKLVYATPNPDYLHINNLSVVGPNKWFDSGDKRFAPDNLLIDSRNANFIAILDKSSGKVVWSLGPNLPAINPKTSQALPRPVDQFVGQHDAHLIPAGLPGAGNVLVFDNQGSAGYPSATLGTLITVRGCWKSILKPEKSSGNTPRPIPRSRAGRFTARSSAARVACPTAIR